MPYLNQYKMEAGQISGEKIVVTLYQTSSFSGSGTPSITSLIAADSDPFSIRVIDNDKNKFKVIRGKQATIKFLSQPGITASTFSSGADDEWIVEAIVESTGFILFKGYLVMDDHQQLFLPAGTYTVTLTATDGLALLDEIPLTDDSGNYIRGYKKIIDIVSQCLRKTNLQLDIIVRDTWMEESQTSLSPACDVIHLHMKTFEKSIGEAVDCKRALEIICSWRLSVRQYNGQWWIENIDEKTSNDAICFQFDYTGAYVTQLADTPHNQTIGRTQEIKFINADTIVNYFRPCKYTKLTFNYQFPAEILDNIDFSRGGFLAFNTGTLIATYTPDDWLVKAGNDGTATPTINARIEKKFTDINMTYEVERYIHLTAPPLSTNRNYLESNGIPLHKNDKFDVSVDFRFANNTMGLTAHVKIIVARLEGDDGSFWVLARHPLDIINYSAKVQWIQTDSSYTYLNSIAADIKLDFSGNTDYTEWQSTSREATPLPVDGIVYIQLNALNQLGADLWDNKDIYYSNLQFNYTPFINGAYSKYAGQSNKIEQSDNNKANIDEVVYMGDSPKKLFKGAMFKLVSSKYVLTERWFAGGDLLRQSLVPPYPPTDDSYLHPFGHLQIYAVWNQYNRDMIGLSGSLKGLRLSSTQPDLIDNYTVDAAVPEAENKSFMLVSTDNNYKDERWSGVFIIEVDDSVIGRDYSTELVFRYETNKS